MNTSPIFFLETIHKNYVGEADPIFFDKSSMEWVYMLEKNFQKIKESLAPLMHENFEGLIINPETHIQFPPKYWKSYPFYFNGIKFKKNLRQFPYMAQQLEKIPHLISASISVLEPGSRLLPHNGSTNAVMRVHLPLKVPGEWPECGMSIEGHDISWKEGEIFMFCDMKMHHVQNFTKERRYILMLDVMRPEFIHLKKKVCIHTIARIATNVVMNVVKKVIKK